MTPPKHTAHTPAPWSRKGRTITTSRGIICIAPNLPEGGVFDKEVNLKLIAAAPDMYEALKAILAAAEGCNTEEGLLLKPEWVARTAEAAIKKAEEGE